MRAQGLDIPMFGLAKRLDEIVLPVSEESILLDRHSEALHLIERLRDEAHRFAITHHRALRQKKGVGSKLEEIPGIGPRRRRAILTHFKTMEALRSATEDEIARCGRRDKGKRARRISIPARGRREFTFLRLTAAGGRFYNDTR